MTIIIIEWQGFTFTYCSLAWEIVTFPIVVNGRSTAQPRVGNTKILITQYLGKNSLPAGGSWGKDGYWHCHWQGDDGLGMP